MSKQKYPQKEKATTTGKPTRTNKRERYNSEKLHAKRNRKRDEAEERQAKYDRLTLTQQLATCIPGGSKRQRARIEAAMAKALSKTPPAVKIAPPTEVQKPAKAKRAAKKKVAAK
jgi:hypothetical protein